MENNMQFLPIGTVVLLKGGKKRVMVTGFCVVSEEKKDTAYDYCGCAYPEGVISSKQTLLFNNNQIEKIYYMGYSDAEEKEFKQKLIDTLKEIIKNKGEKGSN